MTESTMSFDEIKRQMKSKGFLFKDSGCFLSLDLPSTFNEETKTLFYLNKDLGDRVQGGLMELWFEVGRFEYKKPSFALRFVENIFQNPVNITKEEAALFKLEYGFDYPKELMEVGP